jgi:hypothetical protein
MAKLDSEQSLATQRRLIISATRKSSLKLRSLEQPTLVRFQEDE